MTNERTIICTRCIGQDPEHYEWDGWRGDCPYYLRGTPGADPHGTCSYGDCASPNIAEPLCQTMGPQGTEPNPRGEECWECGGTGTMTMIRDSRRRTREGLPVYR